MNTLPAIGSRVWVVYGVDGVGRAVDIFLSDPKSVLTYGSTGIVQNIDDPQFGENNPGQRLIQVRFDRSGFRHDIDEYAFVFAARLSPFDPRSGGIVGPQLCRAAAGL